MPCWSGGWAPSILRPIERCHVFDRLPGALSVLCSLCRPRRFLDARFLVTPALFIDSELLPAYHPVTTVLYLTTVLRELKGQWQA